MEENADKVKELRETLFTIQRMMVEKYPEENVFVFINDDDYDYDDDDEYNGRDRLSFKEGHLLYEYKATRIIKKSIDNMSEEQLFAAAKLLPLLIQRLDQAKAYRFEQKEKLRLENERKFTLAFEAANEALNLLRG